MKIPSKLPINVISNKLNGYNKLSGFSKWKNIVSVDTNQITSQKNKKSYSVKFINYVEPYDLSGSIYTLFYTEVDHNLSVGDRVFIVGGYYDSDVLIKAKRFKSGSDGYIVQYVDKTKLVLNIEYSGELPWIEESIDNFIKVYVASTQDEFDYLLQTTSNRGDYQYTTNRFSSFGAYSTNNILYINGTFSINSGDFGIIGFSQSGYSLTCSNSFLVLGGSMSGYLTDITSNILNATYSVFLSNSLTNIDRIKVINSDFEIGSTLFKKDYVYLYDTDNSKWVTDRKYMPSFVTEQNFRNGFFKYGQFNQGLLGTNLERINYLGSGVSFTLGTILNVNWIVGNIGPGNGNTASFFTSLDDFGQPLIKSNSTNNSGYGYNYIYDTKIGKSIISNGNFYNTIIGSQSNSPVLYNTYLSIAPTYSVISYGGFYNKSIIESSLISNSVVSNTYVNNSKISKSKSINSEFDRTLFERSKFTSDNIIKIESYQEGYMNWYDSSALKFFKTYKFYLTETNFNRLSNFKNFYFSGLKISNKKQSLLNFFDDKFTIGSYDYTYDTDSAKLNKKVIVQLSTKEDNRKYNDINNYLGTNSNYGLPSIDILVNDGEDFNNEIAYQNTDYYTIDISPLTFSSDWDVNPLDITLVISDSDGTNYQYLTVSAIIGPSIVDNILQGLIGLNVGTFSNDDNIFTVNGTYSYIEFSLVDSNDDYYLSEINRITNPYISSLGDFIDVSKSYILDSDFRSGLFKDSDWITGNYINYNKDNALYTSNPVSDDSDGLYSATILDNTLKLNIKEENRYKLFDVGDVLFLNSIFSDTSLLIGGENLVRLPSVYKVNEYLPNSSDRLITIEDFVNGTASVISSIPNDNEKSLLSKNAENNYNYLHPVKFQGSNILSGIFIRSYFDECILNSELFNNKDKNPIEFSNYRSLLISDTIFSNNNNKIKAGLVYNSSFTSGSDVWNNGIFLNSIWNGESFTYSNSYVTGTVSSLRASGFSDGILKQSRWVDGVFAGGSFYKNNSNQIGTSSVSSDNILAYYRKKNTFGISKTRYAWLSGTFKSGDFELSNFEDGLFREGEFYNSNFINGESVGGAFGKRGLPYYTTKILSGSFSNAKIIGAEFKAQNPTGESTGTYSIDWYSGYFNNGLFGVKVDSDVYNSTGLSYSFTSTWYDGEFNGGEFSDIAVWKNGKFNGGKFLSTYGYPFVTKSDYSTATSSLYAWQSGEFNGGEFGTGLTGANSTWYTGEFNGGIFKGRYWNSGIFTNGSFFGSSLLSTKLSNISEFVSNFSDDFYGLWNNGIVSESKDLFIKNKKFYSILDRSVDRKKKISASLNNILWLNGTFSHIDGSFNDSVWLNGSFEKGQFDNSSFNPYLNYIVNSDFSNAFYNWQFNFSDYYNVGAEVVNISRTLAFSGTSSSIIAYQTTGLEIGEVYTAKITVNDVTNAQLRFGNQIDPIYNGNFNTEDIWVLYATSSLPTPTTELIIATGFAGKLQYTDVDGVSNDAYSLAIYPGVLTVGRSYDVILYVSNYVGSYGVQIGSTNHGIVDGGVTLTGNETYETGFLIGNGIQTITFVPEYEDFTVKIFSTSDDPCYVEINGISVTSNKKLTDTTTSGDDPIIYSFTFSAYGPDIAIEFIELADTVSNDTVWNGSTCSIANVEVTKGDSGFNLQDTCVWNGGILKNSEFYISKWNGGRWVSGDAYGMIWEDGIADYMNAYNIYWGGGIWKNGNWNGSPFNNKNINSDSTVSDGFVSDILTNVSLYRKSVSDIEYRNVFLNNAFTYISPSTVLSDPDIASGFTSVTASVYSGASLVFNKGWFTSSTYPSTGGINILDYGVRTSQIGQYGFTSSLYSDVLYAKSDTLDLDIFTSSLYDIEIDYAFQYYSTTDTASKGLTAAFDIRVGNDNWKPSETLNNWGGYTVRISDKLVTATGDSVFSGFSRSSFFASTGKKTIKLTYNPILKQDSSLSAKRLSLRQIYSNVIASSNVTLYILRVYITKNDSSYNSQYNNATYSIFSVTPSYLDTLQLPDLIVSSYQPYFSFGNGVFTSGTNSSIWENGVWNEGIRYDDQIVYFDDLQFFNGTDKPISYAGEYDKKISKIGMISSDSDFNLSKVNYNKNRWIISIEKISGGIKFQNIDNIDQSSIQLSERFRTGDKVAVGNIICIDINNNRRLLKDYLTVIDVGLDASGVDRILLEAIVNFPIRKIEKDSDNHPIYISKNVWLNGAFLNGLFKGVWNNGLFRGYPYITTMIDSQWIDGKFDGGHFKGVTMSIEAENDKSYNSSLIQNFTFNDNNVEYLNLFKYNSWIDVVHFTYSMTNLYRDSITYDYGFKTNKPILNYNGYPTVDILSSVSSFRNGYDSESKKYSLGYKSIKYVDYIENYKFEYPVSSTQSFSILGVDQFDDITTDYSLSTTHSVPGLFNFVENGWRPLPLNSGDPAEYSANTIFNSKYNNLSKLLVKGVTKSGINLLENLNTIAVPENRYTVIEFGMSFSAVSSGGSSYNFKFPYLLNAPNGSTEYESTIPTFIGHNKTPNVNKIEYFYNKPSLQMVLAGTLEYSDIYYNVIADANTVGLTFSTPHGLIVGDIIYLNKIDRVIDIEIDGTYSVVAVTNPYHITIPSIQTNILSGVGVPSGHGLGTDGGIIFLYRPYSAYFDYIKFYEVDMIPFFLYATESRINDNVQIPRKAIAPLISKSEFTIVDSIVLPETLFNPISAVGAVVEQRGLVNLSIFPDSSS